VFIPALDWWEVATAQADLKLLIAPPHDSSIGHKDSKLNLLLNRNQGTNCFSPLNDPSVFGVFQLLKYFDIFTSFISHAILIFWKNISSNHGITTGINQVCSFSNHIASAGNWTPVYYTTLYYMCIILYEMFYTDGWSDCMYWAMYRTQNL
jgi:hypothetical protein